MTFGNRIGPNLFSSGQPSLAEFRRLPAAGFKRVIDLRPSTEEHGFDEPQQSLALGLEYLHLPIAGEADLTVENVRRLDGWLDGPDAPTTLIHCGSANRVGALLALRAAWLSGMDPEAALAEGRSAGLKGLEGAVRAAIEAGPAPRGDHL